MHTSSVGYHTGFLLFLYRMHSLAGKLQYVQYAWYGITSVISRVTQKDVTVNFYLMSHTHIWLTFTFYSNEYAI